MRTASVAYEKPSRGLKWHKFGNGLGAEGRRGFYSIQRFNQGSTPWELAFATDEAAMKRGAVDTDRFGRFATMADAKAKAQSFDGTAFSASVMARADEAPRGPRSVADSDAVYELVLYADNTSELYPQKQAIIRNLTRKVQKGVYKADLAAKLWGYWMDQAAKAYWLEHGDPNQNWHEMFNAETRREAARIEEKAEHGEILLQMGKGTNESPDCAHRHPPSVPTSPCAEESRKKKLVASNLKVRVMYDQDPDPSYLEQDEFTERLEAYRNDAFHFVGIRVEASVVVNGVAQKITSGGLWGIESDSGRDYMKGVASEEYAELEKIAKHMGAKLPPLDDAEWEDE